MHRLPIVVPFCGMRMTLRFVFMKSIAFAIAIEWEADLELGEIAAAGCLSLIAHYHCVCSNNAAPNEIGIWFLLSVRLASLLLGGAAEGVNLGSTRAEIFQLGRGAAAAVRMTVPYAFVVSSPCQKRRRRPNTKNSLTR